MVIVECNPRILYRFVSAFADKVPEVDLYCVNVPLLSLQLSSFLSFSKISHTSYGPCNRCVRICFCVFVCLFSVFATLNRHWVVSWSLNIVAYIGAIFRCCLYFCSRTGIGSFIYKWSNCDPIKILCVFIGKHPRNDNELCQQRPPCSAPTQLVVWMWFMNKILKY